MSISMSILSPEICLKCLYLCLYFYLRYVYNVYIYAYIYMYVYLRCPLAPACTRRTRQTRDTGHHRRTPRTRRHPRWADSGGTCPGEHRVRTGGLKSTFWFNRYDIRNPQQYWCFLNVVVECIKVHRPSVYLQ